MTNPPYLRPWPIDSRGRPETRRCLVYQPGLMPYAAALAWQQSLVAERKQMADLAPELAAELEDVLILLEHPPVYTLKQTTNREFVNFDLENFDQEKQEYEVHYIDRGGEVTYHCPGQIVGYPILNLKRHRPDLHWYLRQLEEVLIRLLAAYGLQASRIAGLTGVWVEGKKLAAIGIKVSRWITMHGFALNVCPDLAGFQRIVPCGIRDKPVGCLAEFIPGITIAQVQPQLLAAFSQVFGVELVAASE